MEGAESIAAERQRQVDAEGWTLEHDATHDRGEMALAARCYLAQACRQIEGRDYDLRAAPIWPNGWKFKPADNPIRNLVKAGALIAAEIDRLQRQATP